MNRRDRRFHVGTIVRHFKGGLYRIEDFSRHTETGEMMVIYRQGCPPYQSFARPEPIFCSPVDKDKYPNATQEYRFEIISMQEAKEMMRANKRREPQAEVQNPFSDYYTVGNTLETEE